MEARSWQLIGDDDIRPRPQVVEIGAQRPFVAAAAEFLDDLGANVLEGRRAVLVAIDDLDDVKAAAR